MVGHEGMHAGQIDGRSWLPNDDLALDVEGQIGVVLPLTVRAGIARGKGELVVGERVGDVAKLPSDEMKAGARANSRESLSATGCGGGRGAEEGVACVHMRVRDGQSAGRQCIDATTV